MPSQRGEWIKGLLRTSNQSTLSFFVAKPTAPSPESAGMERKLSTGTVGVGYDSKGNKLKQSSVVSNHALKLIGAFLRLLRDVCTRSHLGHIPGDVVRLSPSALKLFGRLSLVYHRTAYSSPSGGLSASSPLTMSLLARFGKRRYPKYIVSRSWALFASRQMLREFEAAMQIEKLLEECLDGLYGPGAPKRIDKETRQEKLTRYRRGTEIWESIEDEWRRLCSEAELEMKIKEEVDEAGERRLYYRRRFHPGWPLSRAAYKAAACYAKLVRPFGADARGRTVADPLTFSRAITTPKSKSCGISSRRRLSAEASAEIGTTDSRSSSCGTRSGTKRAFSPSGASRPRPKTANRRSSRNCKARRRKRRTRCFARDGRRRSPCARRPSRTRTRISVSSRKRIAANFQALTREPQSTSRLCSAESLASNRRSRFLRKSVAHSTCCSQRPRLVQWKASGSTCPLSDARAYGAPVTARRFRLKGSASSSTSAKDGKGESAESLGVTLALKLT